MPVSDGNYRTLGNTDAPTLWPQCSEPTCRLPFVFRRAFTMAGTVWLWSRDCKHKKAQPVMMTADGEYLPPRLEEET